MSDSLWNCRPIYRSASTVYKHMAGEGSVCLFIVFQQTSQKYENCFGDVYDVTYLSCFEKKKKEQTLEFGVFFPLGIFA